MWNEAAKSTVSCASDDVMESICFKTQLLYYQLYSKCFTRLNKKKCKKITDKYYVLVGIDQGKIISPLLCIFIMIHFYLDYKICLIIIL